MLSDRTHLRNQGFSAINIFFTLVCLIATSSLAFATPTFKIYPLASDYFEMVYQVKDNNLVRFLTISCKEKNMLSISITKSLVFREAPRFDITGGEENPPKMMSQDYTFFDECNVDVTVGKNNYVEIRRKESNLQIFTIRSITISEGHSIYNIIDHSIKWGMGERFQNSFHITDGKWTLWNRDKPWKIDLGQQGLSDQTYGHQPVYLARETQSKLYHLTYFKNTHGLLFESTKNSSEVAMHSVGGNPHFILILGDENPQKLLEKYHEYIGKAHIPPFWSLGYHQCRWGYKTFEQIREVITKLNQHHIPIDTIWNDLDYMNKKMIFTVNEALYPPEKINHMLQTQLLHYIPLIDVGVSIHDQIAMKLGKQMKVFIHQLNNPNNYYIAEVWPGMVHFPDFLNPNVTKFWGDMLERLHQKIHFSGIWLDMNEPSNFRGNEPTSENYRIQKNQGINQMTININLNHYSTLEDNENLYHKEVHAYYGHLSTIPTFKFLQKKGRPFIISRSNSVGTGRFAGHWTGDNVASWQFLRLSISGNFLYQIFGIQMVGSDICGFHLDTTEQLCSRWMQLGSFYPFARNHNDDQGRPQEPYAFGETLSLTSQYSLKTRYALLKQLYTTLLSKKGKGSFFRPIFFQFYSDQKAYTQNVAQTQILIGDYLMVTPIVVESSNSREVYFPGVSEVWYEFKINYLTGKLQEVETGNFYNGGITTKIQNKLPAPPSLFLRSGKLIFTNVPQLRSQKIDNEFHLLAILNADQTSTGNILSIADYHDEKYISKCVEEGCLLTLLAVKSESVLKVSWKYRGHKQTFAGITIKTVTVVKENVKWRSQQIDFKIETMEGSMDLTLWEYENGDE